MRQLFQKIGWQEARLAWDLKSGGVERGHPTELNPSGEHIGEQPKTRAEALAQANAGRAEVGDDIAKGFAEQLAKPTKLPEWYHPDMAIDTDIAKRLAEPATKADVEKTAKQMSDFGVSTTPDQLSIAIGRVLSSQLAKVGKADEAPIVGKQTTSKLGEHIKLNGTTLTEWLTKRYGTDAKAALAELLKTKNIDAANTQGLVEYLAFGNISADLATAEKYLLAINQGRLARGEPTIATQTDRTVSQAQKSAQDQLASAKAAQGPQMSDLGEIFNKQGPVAAIMAFLEIISKGDGDPQINSFFAQIEKAVGPEAYAKLKADNAIVGMLDRRGQPTEATREAQQLALTQAGLKKLPGVDFSNDELAALGNNTALSLTAVMNFKVGSADKLGDVPAAKVLALQKFITENGARAGLDVANDANKTKPVLVALTRFQSQLFPQKTQTVAANTPKDQPPAADAQQPDTQQPTQNG